MTHVTRIYHALQRTKRLALPVAAAAALAGSAFLTVPGAAQAQGPQFGPDPGASSGTGIAADLGEIYETRAKAAHPDGPGQVEINSVEIGGIGDATTVFANASGEDADGSTMAEAGLADLGVEMDGIALNTGPLSASCTAAPGEDPTADVNIDDAFLRLPGMPDEVFASDPEPNTTIELPSGMGRIVLNEQKTGDDGSMVVNAVHVYVEDGTSAYYGDMTVGTASCLAGEAPADAGTLTGAAEEAGSGHGVDGVVFEVVDQQGNVMGNCATGSGGTCSVDGLEPGRAYAYVCVAEVPEPYAMPASNVICSGPYDVEAGETTTMRQPFTLETDSPGSGSGSGSRDTGDAADYPQPTKA
jgi:hypothetical protein